MAQKSDFCWEGMEANDPGVPTQVTALAPACWAQAALFGKSAVETTLGNRGQRPVVSLGEGGLSWVSGLQGSLSGPVLLAGAARKLQWVRPLGEGSLSSCQPHGGQEWGGEGSWGWAGHPFLLPWSRVSQEHVWEGGQTDIFHDHLVGRLWLVVLFLHILIYFCNITSQSDLDPQPGTPHTAANSLLCSSLVPN